MTEEHPTRRELMRPVQLLGLSALAALFAGVVTLVSMGFFQQRFRTQAAHALDTALIVAGITFIATIVIISLLLLAVKPAEFTTVIDKPVLIAEDERAAARAARDAAGPAEPAADAPASDAPEAERGESAEDGPAAAS
ncbi:hypothetical protein [Microbacterium mangrovi]|uniref:hypothetical protein n=1 Tax=Microbacterium mangrovi TaxID=1348253 RepID=UPI00068C46E9|nr:hypothetical protein [Microbacterium mangrovi]